MADFLPVSILVKAVWQQSFTSLYEVGLSRFSPWSVVQLGCNSRGLPNGDYHQKVVYRRVSSIKN